MNRKSIILVALALATMLILSTSAFAAARVARKLTGATYQSFLRQAAEASAETARHQYSGYGYGGKSVYAVYGELAQRGEETEAMPQKEVYGAGIFGELAIKPTYSIYGELARKSAELERKGMETEYTKGVRKYYRGYRYGSAVRPANLGKIVDVGVGRIVVGGATPEIGGAKIGMKRAYIGAEGQLASGGKITPRIGSYRVSN